MPSNAAPFRRDLIHFGVKKRFVGHLVGLGVIALRLANLFQRRPEEKKVVILEPFGLGDIVSFEPLVRVLKANGYQIAICGKREWKGLYPEGQQLKWIDSELPWVAYDENKKYSFKRYTSRSFRTCLRSLRKWARGAVGLDTRGDIRSVALLRLAGCSRVISVKNYLGTNLKVTPGTAQLIPFDHTLHRWQLNLKFHTALSPGSRLDQIRSPSFEHLSAKQRPDNQRVGLIPVAPWSGKLWAAEKWQKLIKQLQAKKIEVIGLCGPGQMEQTRQELQAVVPLKECDSIESWAAALNECAAVVALDSGPMHLADALGISTIALFGQGKLPLWAPSSSRSRTISHQNDADFVLCQPIDRNASLGRKFMNRITVDEVLAAVEEVLG